MKIIKRSEPFDIDVKRFYLPFVLEAACPNCGAQQADDLSIDYLSYPTAMWRQPHRFWCRTCDKEWDENIYIDIDIRNEKITT